MSQCSTFIYGIIFGDLIDVLIYSLRYLFIHLFIWAASVLHKSVHMIILNIYRLLMYPV